MTFDPSPETPAGGLPPAQSLSDPALSDSVLPDPGTAGLPSSQDAASAPSAEPDASFGGELLADSPTADQAGAAPQPPADAARANARNGRWMMNEGFDGWVLLGADGKPVMRNDRSRVAFRFHDAARLAQELAASDEESGEKSGRRALAPLDSGFNADWDPRVPRSRLADRTKLVKLLAYHYVQTTEPEEAVRAADLPAANI